MKRTTMFRENNPLGLKHILRVDCMIDNQALIMQKSIWIVKIPKLSSNYVETDTLLLLNRYVTQLLCQFEPKLFNKWSCIYWSVIEDWLLKIFHIIKHMYYSNYYIYHWITVTDWYLSSAISLIRKLRHSLQFPSIILPGVSGWRLSTKICWHLQNITQKKMLVTYLLITYLLCHFQFSCLNILLCI